MDTKTQIIIGKNEQRAMIAHIVFPADMASGARTTFIEKVRETGLEEDGVGKIMDMGQTMELHKDPTQPYVNGASGSALSEYCIAHDVVLAPDGSRGALVSVRPISDKEQPSKEKLDKIIHTIATVALDVSIEYITDEEVFEDPGLETIKGKTRKVLLDAIFPQSDKTIKEVLAENGLQIGAASIFRIDGYEIVH